VTSFTWFYDAGQQPGKRTWTMQPDGTWQERYPNGSVAKVFDVVKRGNVDGCAGAVVASSDDKGLEVFIPDLGCKLMRAKFRRGSANWSNMADMNSIGTAARIAQAPPPQASPPPGGPAFSASANGASGVSGKVPSEWEGKWLLLRGEFCTTPDKPPNDSVFCGDWDWMLSLGSDFVRVTGDVPYGETLFKMNRERCALDGKTSPQQGRSDEMSAMQYSCKLEDGTISFGLTSVLKQQQVILPGTTLEKNSYDVRVRLLDGGQCEFVALDHKGRSTTNFKGGVEHRSNSFDTGGGLKRNISCQVFSDEQTARKRYKGRAELQQKGKTRSGPSPGKELGD
jgi:hypothetical protein